MYYSKFDYICLYPQNSKIHKILLILDKTFDSYCLLIVIHGRYSVKGFLSTKVFFFLLKVEDITLCSRLFSFLPRILNTPEQRKVSSRIEDKHRSGVNAKQGKDPTTLTS